MITTTQLQKNQEYVLVNNYEVIIAEYIKRENENCVFLDMNTYKPIYVFLPDAIPSNQPKEYQYDDVFCVYSTEDYINGNVPFVYTNILVSEKHVSSLMGHTFNYCHKIDDGIVFGNNAITVTFRHVQECCEDVWLEDINGKLNDLVGFPIVRAEEKHGMTGNIKWYFYTIATKNGYVDLRFSSEDNSMYSTNATLYWEPNVQTNL
jgi:hypothetical protein